MAYIPESDLDTQEEELAQKTPPTKEELRARAGFPVSTKLPEPEKPVEEVKKVELPTADKPYSEMTVQERRDLATRHEEAKKANAIPNGEGTIVVTMPNTTQVTITPATHESAGQGGEIKGTLPVQEIITVQPGVVEKNNTPTQEELLKAAESIEEGKKRVRGPNKPKEGTPTPKGNKLTPEALIEQKEGEIAVLRYLAAYTTPDLPEGLHKSSRELLIEFRDAIELLKVEFTQKIAGV